MPQLNSKYPIFLASLITTLLTLSPVLADDTEIYISNNNSNTSLPNILFILDNSGSMRATQAVSSSPYDKNVTYSGSWNASKAYGFDDAITSNNWDEDDKVTLSLASSYLKCNELFSAFTRTFTYQDKFARYRSSKNNWRRVKKIDYSSKSQMIECKGDSGKHGVDPISVDVYAADNASGYSSSSNNVINWGSTDIAKEYIFYTGNYINFYQNHRQSTFKTRFEIVQETTNNLVNSLSSVNVGLMAFNFEEGGNVLQAVEEVSATRVDFINKLNTLSPSTWTPLSEILFESMRYFKGDTRKFGDSSKTDAAALTGSNPYKSPITSSCQKNNVVLLTDGEPTRDENNKSAMESYIGLGSSSCSGNCLEEVAGAMANQDLSPLEGDQNATIYTVAFAADFPFMKATAEAGGGKYFQADNTDELETALRDIVQSILSQDTTFTAPAVSVNAFNSLQHLNDVYFAIFKPQEGDRWDGNVKKYTISGDGTILDSSSPPKDAIDGTTGFFADSAKSAWSAGADGKSVTDGGVGEQLTASRTLYTYINNTTASNESLTSSTNTIAKSNSLLSKAVLDITSESDAYRETLIDWLLGKDVNNVNGNGTSAARNFLADPLHSQPLAVAYGGTADNPDTQLYYADNMGVLHSIDTGTGKERFGFIPQELLPNVDRYFSEATGNSKPYGLDGPLTAWANDVNNNGVIYDSSGSLEAGEGIYLYVGMRRGGQDYYALDVTDRSAPKLMWQIKGGTGNFTELGESWSKPTFAKVKWGCSDSKGSGCTVKNVLFFTGGYDSNQDETDLPIDDVIGRAIYMVDAETGSLLWSAGNGSGHTINLSSMKNSFPSDVTIGDLNADGYADVLFAVDINGRMWRMDFNHSSQSGANFYVSGGIIAELGSSNASLNSETRRFFNKPNVVFFNPTGAASFLTIGIGSGYRASPLNTDVTDRFYVIKDLHPFTPPSSYDYAGSLPLRYADLYNATDNLVQDGTATQQTTALDALRTGNGWYINLDSGGEKVLSDSTTFAGALIFTTFSPTGTTSSVCGPDVGQGKVWVVNMLTGAAVFNLNNDTQEVKDRSIPLLHGGLPPSPSIIFAANPGSDNSNPEEVRSGTAAITLIGTEAFDFLKGVSPISTLYWRAEND